MDFDTVLRLLNTAANYVTAVAIIVLLIRYNRVSAKLEKKDTPGVDD